MSENLTHEQIIALAQLEHLHYANNQCPPTFTIAEIDQYIASKRDDQLDDQIAQVLINTPDEAVLNGAFSDLA